MRSTLVSLPLLLAVALITSAVREGHAQGVDGVVLIDQAGASAGGVTPGDAAGFPVTISRSGSYRLSSNLDVSDPNRFAIVIEAEDVTLDLNGFVIAGPVDICEGRLRPTWCGQPVAPGIGTGSVGVISQRRNTTIMNGTVRAWRSYGVHLLAPFGRIERLTVADNHGGGINTQSSLISGNIIARNRGVGIWCLICDVVGNTVWGNQSYALSVYILAYANNALVHNNADGDQVDPWRWARSATGANICNGVPCP